MEKTEAYKKIAPAFMTVYDDLINKGHTHYWLKGGRASGKSSFVSLAIVDGVMHMEGANAMIYRKYATTLTDSVVAQCLWAAEELGVREEWSFKKSAHEMVHKPTGRRIMFRGTDDPEKSKGIKLSEGYFAYVWFEELSEYEQMEDVETILRSLMRSGGHTSVFYTYNPPRSKNNWVNSEAIAQRSDRLIHHSTYLDLPKDWIGEQFIAEAEHIKKTSEQKYRWAYLGESTGSGGAVFENLVLREITDGEILTFDRLYDGLDFGFAVDPTAYVCIYYSPALSRLVLFDEFVAVRASYDRIAEEIIRRNKSRIVVADSSEPRSIEELRSRGIAMIGAKKGPGSIEHGMSWLQDLSEIVIDPKRTPVAAREFSAYEYRRDGRGAFMPAFPDGDNHTIDAARYAMESVMTMRRVRAIEGLLI